MASFCEKLSVDPKKVPEEIALELEQLQEAAESGEGVLAQGGAKKNKSGDSALLEFGKDLTELAAAGEMDPLVGREEEIERAIQILARRQKNNPVLIGELGREEEVEEGLGKEGKGRRRTIFCRFVFECFCVLLVSASGSLFRAPGPSKVPRGHQK